MLIQQRFIHISLLCMVGLTPAIAQDSATCCGNKPPIRPIDKTCLPLGGTRLPSLYRSDLLLKYQEVANIDSFAADNNCSDTVKLQLQDLQAKGKAIGADAMIRVRVLANRVRGFQEDPDTPFFSVHQGESKDYFYRATAIKYLEPVAGEPAERAVAAAPALPPGKIKRKDNSILGSTSENLFGGRDRRDNTIAPIYSTTPGSF